MAGTKRKSLLKHKELPIFRYPLKGVKRPKRSRIWCVNTQTTPQPEIEYETYQIGVAYIVKDLLKRLGIAETIDSFMEHQPEIGTS